MLQSPLNWLTLVALTAVLGVGMARMHHGYWPFASAERIEAERQLLRDANAHVRCEAVIRLGKMGSGALPALTEAMQHEDTAVRLFSVMRMSQFGEDARLSLEAAMNDPDRHVRLASYAAMREIGAAAEPSLPALRAAMETEDREIRLAAVRVLGGIGAPAIPVLTETLKDDDPGVRALSAMVLGSMGPAAKDAVSALELTRHDDDHKVRQMAEGAREQIEPSDKVHALANWVGRVFP